MWKDAVTSRVEKLDHPAWGAAHCRRLRATCDAIATSEGLSVDEDILFAAVWLHDIGTFDEFACEGSDPPQCAARAAGDILSQTDFPAEKLGAVTRIIAEHSFEGDRRESVEARVLRDADMLEFLGAIGVVRLLSVVGIEDWVDSPREAVTLALKFAGELPAKMFYETSVLIARERSAETLEFFEKLEAETAQLALL